MIPPLHTVSRLRHYPLFWDCAIAVLLFIGLGATILSVLFLHLHPAASDLARFFVGLLGLLGFVGFLLTSYGSFIEPKRINLYKKSIQFPVSTPLRVAVMGDIHTGPYKKKAFTEKVVQQMNDLNADLIMLVGDFVYDHTSDLGDLEPLKDLRAPLGVFGVLGNHDAGMHLLHDEWYVTKDRSQEITRYLESLGINMLINDSVTLTHGQEHFVLAGIDELSTGRADLQKTMKGAENKPTILLSHCPDIILEKENHAADLIISAHTHGGQVRLPFIGSIFPIPDILGRAYDRGLFTITDKTQLFITHGIGETMARARLFCPPEIVCLTLGS